MAASSNTDCYLCGATNDPDASHCVRCSGQLLRLPSDEPEPVAHEHSPPPGDDLGLDELRTSEAPKKRTRKTRKGNVADQRLSDALGLNQTVEVEADTPDDGSLVDTMVTSIPRATSSADIPLIGTRAGAVPQSAMNSSEFGKRTYILLGLLILVTSWVGYDTLTSEPEGPDTIAFTAPTTTTSTSSTTTTEKPRRVWQEGDISSQFEPTIGRVEMYDCAIPEEPALLEIDVASAVGVSLSEYNILLNRTGADTADVAVVAGRSTTTDRLAVIERTDDGSLVATAIIATRKHLDSELPERDTDEAWFVWYDGETRAGDVAVERQNADIEIVVSATGDAHTVYIGADKYDVGTVSEVDTRLEPIPDATLPANPNVCQRAAGLQVVGAEPPVEATDDQPVEDIE